MAETKDFLIERYSEVEKRYSYEEGLSAGQTEQLLTQTIKKIKKGKSISQI